MRPSTIKRFIHIWFRKNRIGIIDSQTIVGSYIFCCLLSLYFIPFYILSIYDIPSFVMMVFFMVLTYVVAIPWLSKRKFKFRKQWIQLVDVFVFSWFLPLIFLCVEGFFLYSVDRIDKIDNDVICCFAVSIYTIFLIYFRSLYYKHIETVVAKDDEEKRSRGFFLGSGSDITLSTHPGESRPQ